MHVNKHHETSYIKILIFMLIMTFIIGTTIAYADGGANKRPALPGDTIFMHAELLWDEFDTGPAPFDEGKIPDNEKTYKDVEINGALLSYWPSDQAAGTGGFDTYLAISAKDQDRYQVEERGVNTDQTASNQKFLFDEDSAKTRALPLSAVPVVNIEGVLYREFAVDINQLTGASHTSWEVFQIWQTNDQYSIGQYVAYPGEYPSPGSYTGYPNGNKYPYIPSADNEYHHTLLYDGGEKATLVWDLDGFFGGNKSREFELRSDSVTIPIAGVEEYDSIYSYNERITDDFDYQNNSVVMDYMVNEGSGKADYKLYVPHEWFDLDIEFVVFACDFGYTQYSTMDSKQDHGGIIDETEIYGDGDTSPDELISDYYPNHYVVDGEEGLLTVGANDGFEEWGVLGYELSTKSGTKFEDKNANGVKDEGEPGLEGWVIYVDYDDDDEWDEGYEPSDETDIDGYYEITGIWPSSMVEIEDLTGFTDKEIASVTWPVREVHQEGWMQTLPGELDGALPALTEGGSGYCYREVFYPGSVSIGNDFGNVSLKARISITPDDTNDVGDGHTFTSVVELSYDGGSTWEYAGDGIPVDFTNTGVGTPTSGSDTTIGGEATFTINSSVAGQSTVSARAIFSIGSLDFDISTDATGENSGPAVKTWADARISITPDDTNDVGDGHTFTAKVEITTDGSIWTNAPDGTQVTFSLSGVGSPASGSDTTSSGEATFIINSDVAGQSTVSASADVDVNSDGNVNTVSTDSTGENSGPAVKTWADARISITPLEDTNLVGDEHTFTALVEITTNGSIWLPAGSGIEVTFDIKPGSVGYALTPTTVVTNSSSEAYFTITSDETGTTTVGASANVDINSDGNFNSVSTDGTPGVLYGPAIKHWVSPETACAAHSPGIYRFTPSGNWFTYVNYSELTPVTAGPYAGSSMANIYAGQTELVGYVYFTPTSGGVDIDIDLLSGWDFLEGVSVHIQDFDTEADAKAFKPSPGQFEYQYESDELPVEVPLNNYYAVHIVVVGID